VEEFFEALRSLEQEASDIVSTSSVQARQRVEVARERFAEEFHELEENCRQELERELERLSQEWEQRRQEELESYSKQLSKLGTGSERACQSQSWRKYASTFQSTTWGL